MEKQTSQNQKRSLSISDKNTVEKKKKKPGEQPEELKKKPTLDDDFFPSQDPNRNLHMSYIEKEEKNEAQTGVVDDVSE